MVFTALTTFIGSDTEFAVLTALKFIESDTKFLDSLSFTLNSISLFLILSNRFLSSRLISVTFWYCWKIADSDKIF